MRVDQCVCWNIPFSELKRIAAEHDLDLEALMARTGAGEGCGMCRPYLKRMMETGETSFPLMSQPTTSLPQQDQSEKRRAP